MNKKLYIINTLLLTFTVALNGCNAGNETSAGSNNQNQLLSKSSLSTNSILANGQNKSNSSSPETLLDSPNFVLLHSFGNTTNDGVNPYADLIQGKDGNFYGTTEFGGGTKNLGTVFTITPSGQEKVLYSFTGPDGAHPYAGLMQGKDGNFYGTTTSGGTKNLGTVFTITPSGQEKVLYSFTGPDGANPSDALIQGSDGNFYGTTTAGGTKNLGTVFTITLSGQESVLHSFTGDADGSSPVASLIEGTDGNFYGTTVKGGNQLCGRDMHDECGTIYRVTPNGQESILYSFRGRGADGASPYAGLIQGKDGNFYGTTVFGGLNDNLSGSGTVFMITPSGQEKVLYNFGGVFGALPYAGLIQGKDDNFYGTTYAGGNYDAGIVFTITPSGQESILYSFTGGANGADGSQSALIQGSDGDIYGTAIAGGTTGDGVVFKLLPSTYAYIVHPSVPNSTISKCAYNQTSATFDDCTDTPTSYGNNMAIYNSYAYITNFDYPYNKYITICNLDNSGNLNNCQNESGIAATNISFYTSTSGNSYAYLVDPNGTITQCNILSNGLLNCSQNNVNIGQPNPKSITFNASPSGKVSAYIPTYYYMVECDVDESGGLNNCATLNINNTSDLDPSSITFYNNQFAYIVSSNNNAITYCSIDASGNLSQSCQTTYNPDTYAPQNLTISTDGMGNLYAFIANANSYNGNQYAITKCSLNANGTLYTHSCTLTNPSSAQTSNIVFYTNNSFDNH